jgi:short-subunit dehydrogenase
MSKISQGKALVTGASGGFGAIYADRLARRGYDLILVARRAAKMEELAVRLQYDFGVKVEVVAADLGAAADLDRVAALVGSDPDITLLVNNAGTATLAPVGGTEPGQHDAMVALNAAALSRLSLAALPAFKARNKGIIVNIGSVLGLVTLPVTGIYSGTKGYVMNFTQGLQQEVQGTEVFVQLVLPAASATDIWETGGLPLSNLDPNTVMQPEDVVDAALAGLDRRELVTLPSLEDATLWQEFVAARDRLFVASRSNKPASRYNVG